MAAAVAGMRRVFRALAREQLLPAVGSDLLGDDPWRSATVEPMRMCDCVVTYELPAIRDGLALHETRSDRCVLPSGHTGDHVGMDSRWPQLVVEWPNPPP